MSTENQFVHVLGEKLEGFRKLLEFCPDSMLLVDDQGKIITANSQTEKLFGHKKEELVNQPIEILVPQRFRNAHVGHRTKYMASPHVRPLGIGLDLYGERKDGTEIPVEISLSPMQTEAGTLIIAAVRDVNERKRALKELQLLHSIFQDIGEVKDFHSALGIAIHNVCEATGWDYGEAWVYEDQEERLRCSPAWYSSLDAVQDFRKMTEPLVLEIGTGLPGRVWLTRQPEWIQDLSKSPNLLFSRTEPALRANLKSAFAVPVVANGQAIAVLAFFMTKTQDQDERLIKVISTVTAQLGLVMQRKKAEEALIKAHSELEQRVSERTQELRSMNELLKKEIEERKRLELEIIAVSEREQRRIGQDLHDLLGQTLTAASYKAKLIEKQLMDKITPKPEDARKIVKLVSDSIGQARSLARGLYPIELRQHGMVAALKELAGSITNEHQIACNVECDDSIDIGEDAAIQLYRITQEAVNNAVKHGNPKTIFISLSQANGGFVLSVRDDGKGLTKQTGKNQGMGLHIMKYRAGMIGGKLSVQSHPEGGTLVSCSIGGSTLS